MIDANPFGTFIRTVTDIARTVDDEVSLLDVATPALATLVARDDWLPDEHTRPDPSRYQQYLLHCDVDDLFSVVSFVWAPGQSTPVHDHCTWGLVGTLRGSECSQRYGFELDTNHSPAFGPLGLPVETHPGDVDAVSPRIGDIHQVWNASSNSTAISIHVYGGNIGRIRRHVYDSLGQTSEFVSGYVSTPYAQLWS